MSSVRKRYWSKSAMWDRKEMGKVYLKCITANEERNCPWFGGNGLEMETENKEPSASPSEACINWIRFDITKICRFGEKKGKWPNPSIHGIIHAICCIKEIQYFTILIQKQHNMLAIHPLNLVLFTLISPKCLTIMNRNPGMFVDTQFHSMLGWGHEMEYCQVTTREFLRAPWLSVAKR